MTQFPGSARGFTMIELVVVIVLMAILAAVATPRFVDSGAFEGPAFARELASAARYAQKLAVTSGCPVRITVSATRYELHQPQNAPGTACDTALTRQVIHPGTGDFFAADAPAGVTVGGTLPLAIEYKSTGAAHVGGVVLGADRTIPVTGASVVVTARSGLVRVE